MGGCIIGGSEPAEAQACNPRGKRAHAQISLDNGRASLRIEGRIAAMNALCAQNSYAVRSSLKRIQEVNYYGFISIREPIEFGRDMSGLSRVALNCIL